MFVGRLCIHPSVRDKDCC